MGTKGLKLAGIIEIESKKYYPIIRSAEANAAFFDERRHDIAELLRSRNTKTFSLWAKQALQRTPEHEPKPGEIVLNVKVIKVVPYFSEESYQDLADIVRINHAAEILEVDRVTVSNYINEGIFSENWMPGGKTRYVSAKEIIDTSRLAQIDARKAKHYGHRKRMQNVEKLLVQPTAIPPKDYEDRTSTMIKSAAYKRDTRSTGRKVRKIRDKSEPVFEYSADYIAGKLQCYELPPRDLAVMLQKDPGLAEDYFFKVLESYITPDNVKTETKNNPNYDALEEAIRSTIESNERSFLLAIYKGASEGYDGPRYQERRTEAMKKVGIEMMKVNSRK